MPRLLRACGFLFCFLRAIPVNADHTPGSILKLGISLQTPLLVQITDAAAGEYGVERGLDAMQGELQRLLLAPHPQHSQFMASGLEETCAVIDEQAVTAAQLMINQYSVPFRDRLKSNIALLIEIRQLLNEWVRSISCTS